MAIKKKKTTEQKENIISGALANILNDTLLISTDDFKSKIGNSLLINAPIIVKELTVIDNNTVKTKATKTTTKKAKELLESTKKSKNLSLLLVGGTPNEKGMIQHIVNINNMYQSETRSTCERLIKSYDKFINDMGKKWSYVVNLISQLNTIDDDNRIHSVIFERGSAWIVRDFKKPIVVDSGHVTNSSDEDYNRTEIKIRKFKTPLCKIKSIFLDIFSDKIDSTSIYIRTSDGKHPNAMSAGGLGRSVRIEGDFVNPVCTGSLNGQKIYINNVKSIKSILDVVEKQYSVGGLDNPYFTPTKELASEKKEKVNTWGT